MMLKPQVPDIQKQNLQWLQSQYKLSYNGNKNLRPAGVKWPYTVEELDELDKCDQDPIYFIENYCKIVTLDSGLQPFKLHEYQKEMVETILKERKVIVRIGRQAGKTTVAAACLLWYILFNDAVTVAVVANKSASARETLFRLQIMYENLPMFLQKGVKTWNKGDILLESESRIFTAATTSSGIRGKSVNWLYIDEAAIIPNTVAEEFFVSTYPTIISGKTSKVLMTSTPLGYNHFWRMWNAAEQGTNGFVPIYIPYDRIPGRDEKWLAEQKSVLGELKFRQEILCSFLGSSATLISPERIAMLRPQVPMYSDMNLDIYLPPEKDHTYVLVADTSEGVGGDYSAFVVVDISELPYKLAAKYRDNKISPLIYPNVIYKTATKYNTAYVLGEINKQAQVFDILANDMEYENVLWVSLNRKGGGQQVSVGGVQSKYGVVTDKKVKRLGCSTFKDLVEEDKLLIQDQDLISEIGTFIEKKSSFAADDGYHDDLVMCMVLFSWLTTNVMFRDLTDVNLRERLYTEKAKYIEDSLVPFGIIDDGLDSVDKPVYEVHGGDAWFS